jgi:hypothetical protein
MKRILSVLLFLLVFASINGMAQSNAAIDALLAQEQAEYSTTVALVLGAAGLIPENATNEQALEFVKNKNWGLALPAGPQAINFGEYSLLLMKSFNLSGGLMYMLFPNSRYAAREIVFRGYMGERKSADSVLSGDDVMRILGNILASKEERS